MLRDGHPPVRPRSRRIPAVADYARHEPEKTSCGGRLAYRLKMPWRDGTTHVVMERRELLERLAPLIPPPRAHQLR